MSNLRPIDISFLDEVFDMRGGYVLDFSDRTFREFFMGEFDIDIDNPMYSKDGNSKGKRLRCYLRSIDNQSASKTLKALWEYRQVLRERRNDSLEAPAIQGRFLRLIDKLEGKDETGFTSGSPPVPAFGREKFQTFKERLLNLNSLEPQPRGYAFEKFLHDLFTAFGLAAREPFRLKGEQIDGSFILSGETYLIEAKWQNCPCGAESLHAFHGKLEQKAVWARGVFVSYSGFTTDGIQAFGRAKRVVCMDGLDLHEALNREITLVHLIESKVRRAAETGEPFAGVGALFP
jgi:Restriction endonuclease